MSAHSFHNSPGPLSLSVALDGAGWHPAAWRTPNARPDQLFTPGYWAGLVALAERGLLDFVTIEDALGLQSGDHLAEPGRRTDQVRGRLDAALIAAFVAPLTRHIGLIPTITTTHTEPFHIAKAVATLDHNSKGRAGWRVQVSARADEAAHFGRRELPVLRRSDLGSRGANRVVAELFGEAADAVEAVRRLWDSWEDDAEIRDASTNRFIDRDKLNYVNFIGAQFTVRGPSTTPRPPQGQPIVAALAHDRVPFALAASSADVVFVTPHHANEAHAILAKISAAEAEVGRTGAPLRITADLAVLLDDTQAGADARLRDLNRLAGAQPRSDAEIVATTPRALADLIEQWRHAGLLHGFRLRPAVLPDDLHAVVEGLVPELQRRGLFRTRYPEETLRERLGLPRPASRYAKLANAGLERA
ncbi:MAG TPA: LLM class flavin-dependent oxidoreductase [Pseudonocardia sp.]|uniref:LLM class flavin-dependent oxidoreductase n=1 Tax=Pseudonocardia sp. TaxID=60912 RepID=UPI002D0B60ED|nr:LLM class flavin-dependent oxidoreductase [Pseudonocardia sp.]HTF51637.1 LLM class flavin-dependent oxidoreductase [Pseudonocardia sp.]